MRPIFRWRKHFKLCPRCNRWTRNDLFFSRTWCLDCVARQHAEAFEQIGGLYVYLLHKADSHYKRIGPEGLLIFYNAATDTVRGVPKDSPLRPMLLDALVTLGEKLDLDISRVLW